MTESQLTLSRPIPLRAPAGALALVCVATAAWGASPEFHAAVLASAPAVHYRLDEATGNALNHGSLGSSFDAAYLGAPQRAVPGLSGDAAVAITAQTEYLESLSAVPLAFTGNPSFTVEAVIRISSASSVIQYPPILHWGPSDGDPAGRSVFFGFSGNQPEQPFVGFYNGGLQPPDGSLPVDLWHHLVWVRTGGGMANEGSVLFIDGVDFTALLVPDPVLCCNASIPDVGSTELRINRARDLEGTRVFQGILDEVVLYDRELDGAEIQAHYLALVRFFADGFETGDLSRWSTTIGGP